MIWKARAPDAFKYALRALKKEIFGFSFDYPLHTVPESSAKDSLHYHLYSDALRLEAASNASDVFLLLSTERMAQDATPLGRFVNMNRLHIDQYEDADDVEKGAAARESAGLLSGSTSGSSETRV